MNDNRALFRAAVFVMLINKNGEVWLQQRQGSGFMDEHYDFPSGHVDPGESTIESAVREVLEETRTIINPNNLKLVHVNQNFLDTPYIGFTYEIHDWQGIPQIGEPHKCSDAGFFAFDSLPEKVTLNVRLLQRFNTPGDVTHSKVTPENFEEIMTGIV